MLDVIIVFLGVILAFVFIIGGYMISSYNWFINLRQDVQNQFSNIKTEYQRRADLFINLVESVKAYKNFEKSTLKEVIALRSGIDSELKDMPKTRAGQMKSFKKLDGLFNGIKVTFEQYPELKAVEQFNLLFNEVRITEDRINVARTDYNGIVNDYNVAVTEFPINILAGMFNFRIESYFKNESDTDSAPKIKIE